MHRYIHTYIHAYVRAYIHTDIHAYYAHTCIGICVTLRVYQAYRRHEPSAGFAKMFQKCIPSFDDSIPRVYEDFPQRGGDDEHVKRGPHPLLLCNPCHKSVWNGVKPFPEVVFVEPKFGLLPAEDNQS